jgi:hypothetical protein
MATMSELQAEYDTLTTTRRQLVEDRTRLHQIGAHDDAFQDLAFRTRQYVNALNAYVAKLQTRRKELVRVGEPKAER